MSDITLTPGDVLELLLTTCSECDWPLGHHAVQCSRRAVKHHCVSCDATIGPREEIGACEHGLLCEQCRYDSQCLQCKANEVERERLGDPDDLEDEAYDPDDFRDILRYE